jgi:hypothetical protein
MTGYELAAGFRGRTRWWIRKDPTLEVPPWLDEFQPVLEKSRFVRGSGSKHIYEREGYLLKRFDERGIQARLRRWFFGAAALRVLAVMRRVERLGVPVHPIIAVGTESGQSMAIFPPLSGRLRLDWRYVRCPELRPTLARTYGVWVKKMHDTGIDQYDCNPTNVLERQGELVMIDFERVRFGRLSRARRVERLAHMSRMGGVSRLDRVRFLRAYGGPAWRTLAREIERVRTKVLEHDSRRLIYKCQREGRTWGVFAMRGWRGFYRKPDEETGAWGIGLNELRKVIEVGRTPLGAIPSDNPQELWVRENIEWLWGRRPAPPIAVAWSDETLQGWVLTSSG